MSAFTGSGAVYPFKAADNGRWAWTLAEPLVWEVRGPTTRSAWAGATKEIAFTLTIPENFFTDLGTVPWLGRLVINPADPQLAKAFILHDYILNAFGPEKQAFAASQLYEALRALNAPRWKRKLITVPVVLAIDEW